MGKDKYENEDLIKWGLPIDLWFHVDGLSSAHVYLRLPEGYNIDNIPEEVKEECMQLVKHNSIEGTKLKSVKICYTQWENLEKTLNMDVGQVGYKNIKQVKYAYVEKNKEMIKALNKTMIEKQVDLEKENAEYYREELQKKKKLYNDMKKKQAEDDVVRKKDLSDKMFEYLDSVSCKAMTNKNCDDDDFM